MSYLHDEYVIFHANIYNVHRGCFLPCSTSFQLAMINASNHNFDEMNFYSLTLIYFDRVNEERLSTSMYRIISARVLRVDRSDHEPRALIMH